MRYSFYLLLITFSLLLNSLFAQEALKKLSPADYIITYKGDAIKEMHHSGVPASITLAQGLLESSNGNSPLALNANNHFGIKCGINWTGETLYQDDDTENECFRKYESVYDSYKDHSAFLKSKPRYAFLFELDPTDYKSWANGLKTAGYATNPKYPELIIGLIESNKLYEYDKANKNNDNALASNKPIILNDQIQPIKIEKQNESDKKHSNWNMDMNVVMNGREVCSNNQVKYLIARKGDTYSSLATELEMAIFLLSYYNDSKGDDVIKPGQLVYIQLKKNKATEEFHIANKGETMFSISQKYGVKLKKLYQKNKMNPGSEPAEGQKLWLRKKKTA